VAGVLDYQSAMNLEDLGSSYDLRLIVDGVPVLGGGAEWADEKSGASEAAVAGSDFIFLAAPSAERAAASTSRLPAVVLATGLALALLLAWLQLSREARARSEARFRALMESAPDAGVIVDAAGRIVTVNTRAEKLFGTRHYDLSGTPIGALGRGVTLQQPPTDWEWDDPFELVVPRGDGPDLPVEVTASPIQTDKGLLVSMSLRDVTERNAMIDRLRESDRLKSEFVSTVSHEMRTPLTVIREFSSLVHDGTAGPLNADQAEFLGTVLRNCDRLTGLVGDLLELAQLKSGKYQMDRRQTDIAPLLERCIQDLEALAATKDQLLRLDLHGPLPEVLCDSDRITQVLVNLIGNAHKFTPSGGAIMVSARSHGRSVAVSVEDTGIGIAEEDQATIFGAFVQVGRKDGPGAMGTGLGLNVARQIVELHGGRLTVQSRAGEGSTFTFTLPILDEDLLTGFLAPHVERRDVTETPLSLVLLRGHALQVDDGCLEEAYNAVISIQRVGRDEALLARKHGLVVVALEADESGAASFVRRLASHLDAEAERFECSIRGVDTDERRVASTLDDLGDLEWRPLT
ncbi:MAG: PAS domain S-box protein, partial [Gemmatimonadetes bacterium]|nr:PAS domain S-box protein [Gemmatimonadota bacterium]